MTRLIKAASYPTKKMIGKRLGKAALIASFVFAAMSLSACSGETAGEKTEAASTETTTASTEEQEKTEAGAEKNAEAVSEGTQESGEPEGNSDDAAVRVGSLKGPTTIGLVNMMQASEDGELPFDAEFTMATTADELTAKIVSGDMDIALIPANLASVLYNKTEGKISVTDINTLGVLYGVTGDERVKGLSDLEGKTVYMTGQGSTPEYTFNYILQENGLSDKVTIEFKNEATEIAALLNEDPTKIAVLPQPFATVCMKQNENVKEFLDLNAEWKKCESSGNSEQVTGVTIVRNEFLSENPELVSTFTAEHEKSALKASEDADGTAELIVKYGIIEKAPIAKAALPKCNVACITGEEMKAALQGYLEVLFKANPKSVGGELPGEDFYADIDF